MLYDIEWVKNLSESDLVLCNLLTFMRQYKYNLLFADVEKSVIAEPAEAYGIMRIKVRLRTKDGNIFTTSPYYLHEDEAELFIEKLTECYEKFKKGGA